MRCRQSQETRLRESAPFWREVKPFGTSMGKKHAVEEFCVGKM